MGQLAHLQVNLWVLCPGGEIALAPLLRVVARHSSREDVGTARPIEATGIRPASVQLCRCHRRRALAPLLRIVERPLSGGGLRPEPMIGGQ